MMNTEDAGLTFQDAVHRLIAGDFTRLDPLFSGEPELTCPIVDWHKAGKFENHPQALAEALSCACFNGRTAVARYLLGQGVDPAAGNGTGMNAFHWAANRGQLAAVELLIAHGAPLETLNMYGGTVLGCTVWSAIHETKPAHAAIVEALIAAGADLNATGYPTGSAMVDAVLHRHQV